MSLPKAYTRFVKKRRGRDELVAALTDADHALEAELLAAWAGDGTHPAETTDGRRAWVGPVLPGEAPAGDVWLDVVEAMPMVRVESLGWLALRPVERWQFAGFLAAAKLRAGGKVGGVRPLSAGRLGDG